MSDDNDAMGSPKIAKQSATASAGVSHKISPSNNKKKLIDYTQSRNPNFGDDDSLEKLRASLESLDYGDDHHDSARSQLNSRPRAPARLSIPSFRSIDSGSFSFQDRPQPTEERIDFLFKLQPAKRSRSGPRIDDLLEERRQRGMRRKTLFASLSEDPGGRLGRKKYNSAPSNLHLYQQNTMNR